MEDSSDNIITFNSSAGDSETKTEVPVSPDKPKDISQNLFPESPVYEPDDEVKCIEDDSNMNDQVEKDDNPVHAKRKLSEETCDNNAKILKLDLTEDEVTVTTQTLDDEVSEINDVGNQNEELPSTSRARTPVRSSPGRNKRSNSVEVTPKTPKSRSASVEVVAKNPRTPKSRSASVDVAPKTPKTPKSRSASVDLSKAQTPRRVPLDLLAEKDDDVIIHSDDSSSRLSVEFVRELPARKLPDTIPEESGSELNDSQNFHLILSPVENYDPNDNEKSNADTNYDTEKVTGKEREVIDAGKVATRSGYNYSEMSSVTSQAPNDCKERATDQESTDSIGSMGLDSPEPVASVASKLISKLSNGNSSTPTDVNDPAQEITPDMCKLNGNKGKRGKNESFRVSNTTTPSTISPLQNGHSLPISTPLIPVFDVHVSHNEDCEFLSLYVVRTDNDVGMDMCREYQRISKRFTIDPYLGDVSVSNSPSSVTSGGLMSLPNRTSFASTISSTSSSSTRTSDGAFVVPPPPRKSVSNPTTTVKGYEALMKKLQDIFSHIRDASIEANRSLNDDKISVGIQASISEATFSNGNASPEEVSKCDKATPKSSLKKTRVRGRRPIAGKTKRALLPTQHEEAEYMQGMNSPEMIPSNGDTGKISPKEEKPAVVGTPKSVSKLKQKRRPPSPRPATPVEKAIAKPEYPGFAPDTVVLAKWVDKRYYSGKVLEITEPNKYLIKFDDGQSKVLLDDFIIFGDMKKLPLQGQSVYALVDEELNYEPGLVLGVEENGSGTVTYRCTTDGDTIVVVTASELYLTEDQARSLKESRARSPATPTTPRRRHHRELDLDNIIQGPRSARSRDKGSSSARKRVASPKSPKASTSGVKTKSIARKRLASESSELSENSNSAPARIEEVAGVEPEVQRTPRKIDGVKAGPLQLKGAAKQNIGKKNSKLTKFENDEDTISALGPIPTDSKMFAGYCFLLTCTEPPKKNRVTDRKEKQMNQDSRHYSSEEDGESTAAGTDTEDLVFCERPYNKERLREQLETAGGVVYSHFDDVPKTKYPQCYLISPRPCLTAKYISCLAAAIKAVSHDWVIQSCMVGHLLDVDSFVLPTGWSLKKSSFVNWTTSSGKRNTTFKDKIILLCGDQDTFVKFWERVCTLAGATTRIVNEDNLNMTGAIALVTEWDCPHEVQNKANQDNIPLVSTTWVVQCLIEGKVVAPTALDKFSFMYAEPE
ncbi:Tumor suppressor p53-binding protein 1 [Danaus plexippus plexippus]|uniref:Tumor suppressor p53-binding protein 1 n=1 Tax=Danaus plexippus plexippus TaxID=278856 RepID=A0A212EZ04_DANPL|nr:Tumor suppressor p53-binding protein 1 [Danaus plexippus plexippus]